MGQCLDGMTLVLTETIVFTRIGAYIDMPPGYNGNWKDQDAKGRLTRESDLFHN